MNKATDGIARVSSNESGQCRFCSHPIDGTLDFAAGINHYLTAHGCKVLHVGQEDVPDDQHKPWATTVAILATP